MKKVLFVGIEKNGAVSKILSNLLELGLDDVDICSFGFSNKTECLLRNNIKNYFYEIPNFPSHLLIKIRRKIYKQIHKDYYLLSWKNAYRQLKKISKEFHPDVIVAASGRFCYMKAAYKLAEQTGCRLELMFFDPYQNNSLIVNKNKAIREALNWCKYADRVFYDVDGEKPIQNIAEEKMIPFYIPIFESAKSEKSNKSIVYGGMFYSKFRSPDSLISLINECKDLDVDFNIYTEEYYANEINRKTNNVAIVHELLPEKAFEDICNKCLAIIVLGNGTMPYTIPSKLLEAIGHKKPIIGINFSSLPSYLEKYPYFYLYSGPQTILNICSLDNQSLKEYDIFNNYPERKPSILKNRLLDVIKSK